MGVYVHWSVFVLASIILAGTIRHPLLTLAALPSYIAMILIHECGHLIAAQRCHCTVYSIKLYPIHGITWFERPWSRLDNAIIAWGGVVAQTVVAAPIIAWIVVFGYTRFEPINAILALLGGISVVIAAYNLLPFPGLDGSKAWDLFPALLERFRERRARRRFKPKTDFRTYR